MIRLPRVFLALTLLALSACASMDNFKRAAPGASGAEVTAIYGQPIRVWDDADGGKTLEYSSQPFGQTCYMIKLDKAGKVVSREDTLLPGSRARITAGMAPEQVSRILGRERSRMFFPLSGEDVWDWTVDGGGTGYGLRFNVHFKDGKVLRTSQSMVDRREYFLGIP